MTSTRRIRLNGTAPAAPVALALLVALTVTACGGQTGTLSKTQLISQSDAICQKTQGQLRTLTRGFPATVNRGTLPTIGQIYGQVVPVIRDELGRLGALAPPSADKAKISQMLSLWTQSLDQLDAARKAALTGDVAGFRQARTRSQQLAEQGNAIAGQYGFRVC